MQKTFTIKEIRKYLDGCRMNDGNGVPCRDYNFALDHAITFLDSKEDGIAEILAREKWYIEKRPLDKYEGASCALIAGGSSGIIEKVDNKKRKLLINTGDRKLWISTRTFFDKWYWGPHCNLQDKS